MSVISFTPPRRVIPQRYLPVLATLSLLVAMFVIGALRYPGFASGQVVLNVFIDNAFLLVVAVGMTFVILTGGIDLSLGALRALDRDLRHARPAPGLAAGGRPPRRPGRRRPARLRDGLRDPLLRDPAVH